MFSKINTMGLFGLNAFSVDVETDIRMGQPAFEIVGLPDTVVKESRERIKSAMLAGGIKFPNARVMMNLAPADTKKSGSVHDLAIFMGMLTAMGVITAFTDDCCFIGEVSLNGNVRHVNGVLPMTLTAMKSGIKKIFVPLDNAFEASVVDGIEVYGVKSIIEIIAHFTGGRQIKVSDRYVPPAVSEINVPDFSDIK